MRLSVVKILQEAENYIKDGNATAAEELYRRILSKFPKNKKAARGYQKLKTAMPLNNSLNAQPPREQILKIIEIYNQGHFQQVLSKAIELLNLYPDSFELHNFQGTANANLKRYDASIESYKKAKKINPHSANLYNNMGVAFSGLGDLSAAIESFKKAILIKPEHAEAYYNMGNTLNEMNELDAAIDSYVEATKIKPEYAEAYFNMGRAQLNKGSFLAAINSSKKAAKLNYPDAYYNIAIAFQNMGDFSESIENFKKSIEIRPDFASAYSGMGMALREKGDLDRAFQMCAKAVKLGPEIAEVHGNFGICLMDKGMLNAAIDHFQTALKLEPNFSQCYLNIGKVQKDQGQIDEAIDSYKKAIEINPELSEARSNLALAYLYKKDFKNGWPQYEWRWSDGNPKSTYLKFNRPLWEPSIGGTVLLWSEQGIGDIIMFSSMVEEIYQRVERLIIQIDERLLPLFMRSFPQDIKYYSKQEKVHEASYDAHIPMGSLPLYFRPDVESFGAKSKGWLTGCEVKTNTLRKELLSSENETLIGLSWYSTANRQGAQKRTIPLNQIAQTLNSPKVKLINLQYGEVDKEIRQLHKDFGIKVHQLSEINNMNDLDSLASLICACDRIVSIDNTTIHFSGALGKDSKLLLPYSCDWRWGVRRSTSHWYQSVKLHHQTRINNWDDVLQQL